MPGIVCISGTSRPHNYTSRALRLVEAELHTLGQETTFFDACELELDFPGRPEKPDALRLREAIEGASAVVLASPEYHGSFCAMTKLIIENLGFPSVLSGKAVALVGVAAGRIGAIKTLEQLKGVLSHTGAIVVPGAVSIAGVQAAFDDAGQSTDAGSAQALRNLARLLNEFMGQYICPRYTLEAMVRGPDKPWSGQI